NFYLCNHLYLAFARERGAPLAHALTALREPARGGRLANFLRNHDELDLERLDKQGFDDVMRAFAPREEMRIFGRGIRRRLAPILGDDRRRLELAYSLLLSMP